MRSSSLVQKFKHWVGGDPYEDDMYDVHHDETDHDGLGAMFDSQSAAPGASFSERKAQRHLKVVDQKAAAPQSSAQVIVVEPRAFEEVLDIVENLRSRKAVILNLQMLDTAQSQRVVDFLSGATHAIDGNQHRIGDTVFLFTPHNVSISSQLERGLTGLAAAAHTSEPASYWDR